MIGFPKDARKRSDDPNQEQLRTHKQNWNGEVSELISKLIAFKRGINGRGDAQSGLPPSTIKEKLPSEVSSYLNEVSSSASVVLNEAMHIINEQESYAMNRRRSAERLNELEKIASWWGSRLWAHVPFVGGLKGLPKAPRQARLQLINFAAGAVKKLLEIENIIGSKKPDSIPVALSELTILASDVVRLLFPILDKFVPKPEDQFTSPAEELPEELTPKEESITGEPSVYDKYKKFFKEKSYIYLILNYLKKQNPVPGNLEEILSLFKKIEYESITIDVAQKIPAKQKKLDLEQMAKDVIAKYELLLELVKAASKFEGNSFREIAKSIPGITVKEIQSFFEQENELQKIAANALTRWWNLQKLKFNSDNEELHRISIIEQLRLVGQALDKLLDSLENKDSSINDIQKNNSEFFILFSDLLFKMHSLAERYTLSPGHKKDSPTIQAGKLTKIDSLATLIKNYGGSWISS